LLLQRKVGFEIQMDVQKKILIVTDGTRGDIQPYVALTLGLLKNGWKVGIATHGKRVLFANAFSKI
jgi:UDP:flavonoid glycosyltransferase YjiC (YdhE family)